MCESEREKLGEMRWRKKVTEKEKNMENILFCNAIKHNSDAQTAGTMKNV